MNQIRSEHIDDKRLRVCYGEQPLFEYTYRPATKAIYCPRPFIHPLHTLAGDVVTNSRPTDHPWHNGISLTLTDVNGMNFWGGGTYRRAAAAYGEYDNMGRQDHIAWVADGPIEGGHAWVESLKWIGPKGEHVFTEERTLSVRDVDAATGFWRLGWKSRLTNTAGEDLAINSYCSGEGLEGSGYTGLFMRLSRGFTPVPAYIMDPDVKWDDCHDGTKDINATDDLNGHAGNRVAFQGVFDTSLNGGLLLCEDVTSQPNYQHHWFYRPHMPCLAFSTAFHEPLKITIGAEQVFEHTISIAAGFWTRKQLANRWLGLG